MKRILQLHIFVSFVLLAGFANGQDLRAGPNGGRVLHAAQPLEFLVDDARRVIIAGLDAELRPVGAVKADRIRITAVTPEGRQPVPVERKDGRLVSSQPLPPGEGYQVVVQVFSEPEGKPENFRIRYQSYRCEGCELQEYACICGH